MTRAERIQNSDPLTSISQIPNAPRQAMIAALGQPTGWGLKLRVLQLHHMVLSLAHLPALVQA